MTDANEQTEIALLCRVGFEADLIDELQAWYAARGLSAACRSEQPAVVRVLADTGIPSLNELVFARDLMVVVAALPDLNPKDRVTPIAQALVDIGGRASVTVLTPDSEATKPLAPLVSALEARLRAGADTDARSGAQVWMLAGTHALVGTAPPRGGARFPGGLPRLKFPREAPSRSTLKLDEAFQVLLTDSEREQLLRPGGSAVDLGAAPGGWTYQLVARQIRVTAIDNGRLDARLNESPLVQHLREDGFRYRPARTVDWLVCDMVEKPGKVAELMAHWFQSGWCRAAVFNLKLPMKRRFEAWDKARSLLQPLQALGFVIRARQLYHDREELTVAILPGTSKPRPMLGPAHASKKSPPPGGAGAANARLSDGSRGKPTSGRPGKARPAGTAPGADPKHPKPKAARKSNAKPGRKPVRGKPSHKR